MIDRKELEASVESEVAFWSDLVTVDDGTLARFRVLALTTVPVRLDALYLPKASAVSAFSDPELWDLTGDSLAAWRDYADRWSQFVATNPRIRLADLFETVSESYDGQSWPYGYEDRIHAWVQSGCPEPRPAFASSLDVFEIDELRHAAAGADGWPFYEDGGGQDRGRLIWRNHPSTVTV